MFRFLLATAALLCLFVSAFVEVAASAPRESLSLSGEKEARQDRGKNRPVFPKKVDLPEPGAPCTMCAGEGTALMDCEHCGGDGKGPCLDCAPHPRLAWVERELEVLRIVDPEMAKKVQAMQGDVQKELDKFNDKFGVKLGPGARGTQRCPARCMNGRSLINAGHDCLVCKAKGYVACAPCKGKGEVSCQVCKRKKRHETTCPECIGSGQSFPYALESRAVGDCPWCLGKSLRNCGVCTGPGDVEVICPHCAGSGDAACEGCLGTLRLPCRPCSGTGDLGGFIGRSGPCTDCKHRGFTKCDECKRGVGACKECLGTGKWKGPCTSCGGHTYTLCRGCAGGSARAWLVAAERFLAGGKASAAVAHIEEAIRRTGERHEKEHSSLVGGDSDRKKLRREQKREVQALRKRLDKAKKRLKD